jgi:Domain of unknown function (DUF4395)
MSASPNPSASLTPPARLIDPRGQRFGAGVSAVLLLLAYAEGSFWLAALIGANQLVASAFGTRFFLPGRPWPLAKSALRLRPVELEHEYPPRFAQALGGIFIAVGTVFYGVGLAPLGWVLVAAVAALQTILAVTGFCLGCRLYFLRWVVPTAFARLFRRNDERLGIGGQAIRRVA